jgi:hypothetical protein
MLLYIRVLNQPPYQKSQFENFGLIGETSKDSPAQHHRKQIRETDQRTRVNYSLERRLFM